MKPNILCRKDEAHLWLLLYLGLVTGGPFWIICPRQHAYVQHIIAFVHSNVCKAPVSLLKVTWRPQRIE